ncbi:hypothetical protein [Actinomadura rupiterrae]|uniref:hypothetical protein n=1 Tax=Actinomadura rupiterrae TaxID=559627 RepID=UPI0020A2B0AF|nr:hypothetical protein [Actinomadura rupiterrae]MCP2336888.1 hypothetical protein [Actinomadura rupiterrae]
MRVFRSPAVLLPLLVAALIAIWPAGVGYTVLAGDKATARVLVCQRSHTGSVRTTQCRGTWIKPDFTTGSGHIYNVDESDYGRDVPIRFGPFGPYAHGFDRGLTARFAGFGFGIGICLVLAVVFARDRRKKAAAAAWRASQNP